MNTVEFKEHSITVNKRVSEWKPKEHKENISGWGNVSIPKGTKLIPYSHMPEHYQCKGGKEPKYYDHVYLIREYWHKGNRIVKAICSGECIIIAEFKV